LSVRDADALTARLTVRRGDFFLDAEIEARAGEVTGLFGPSGSGKSTLLRCLAGLDRDARGDVRLGGEVWQDGASGHFLPPHRRGAAYVFQEGDLFPHLDVAGNLRFAVRRARRPGPGLEDVTRWLAIGPLLDRRAAGLSGGERQRVSIARAILSGPRLLLLDEPLSGLDEVGRGEVLPYLEALPRRLDVPVVYVTHALEEAARLSRTMVWLMEGRVRGAGLPAELLGRLDFARWRGDAATVFVDARVVRHEEAYALTLLEGPWGEIWVRRLERHAGERVRIQIDASDVSLELDREGRSSILNRFDLQVLDVEDVGSGQLLLRLGRDAGAPVLLARITRLSRDRLRIAPGSSVHAGVKSVAVLG
jgi:molybdate transport system ATP-binding protein